MFLVGIIEIIITDYEMKKKERKNSRWREKKTDKEMRNLAQHFNFSF